MRAAASALKCPLSWVARAKDSGVDGFKPNGSVILDPVRKWIADNMDELEQSSSDLPLKEQKLAEEVRKLRIRNDRDAGKLVELAWINERFQRFGGELHAIRSKSESEHPVNFGAAAGDVAACRSVLRGIWDDIMKAMQACSKHFEK